LSVATRISCLNQGLNFREGDFDLERLCEQEVKLSSCEVSILVYIELVEEDTQFLESKEEKKRTKEKRKNQLNEMKQLTQVTTSIH
jgi:hypothetical protein